MMINWDQWWLIIDSDDNEYDGYDHVEEGHHHVDEDDQREQRICNGDFH